MTPAALRYYALIMFLAEWLRCPAAFKAQHFEWQFRWLKLCLKCYTNGWAFYYYVRVWRVNGYVFALIDTRQWVSTWFSNLKRTCSFFYSILACHWVFHVCQHTVEDLELFREAVSCTSSELSLPTANIRIIWVNLSHGSCPKCFIAKRDFSKEWSIHAAPRQGPPAPRGQSN